MSLPVLSGIPLPDPHAALTTAGAFLQAYHDSSRLAMDKERQASDLQMRDKQMQRQDQVMAWEAEDRQYRNDVVRPLEEQQMRLGNASQILGLQQQGADLRYREEMTRANSLRTGSDNAIYDSFNADPRIQGGLDAGLRLFGGQPGAGAVSASGGGFMGKATRYGYANDRTPDRNSRAGIGAWVGREEQARIQAGEDTPNKLRAGDLAFSPDVERAMRMAGIRPGQNVALQYADGGEHVGRWMDRTAEAYQGQALTGRFDIYDPEGAHAGRDGQPVMSFKRAGDAAGAAVTTSQVQTMRDAEAVLDAYEAATEYVQRFTGQDSRGNAVLDPRARPIAEQALAMETAIKSNPMLTGMAKQRGETRQEEAAAKTVARVFQFYQPGQLEDFQARQPGAFNVLQRWNANLPVALEDKMQAMQMLENHAQRYQPGQSAARPLSKEVTELFAAVGRAQAMPPPQGRPDPADPKKMLALDAEEVAEWRKAQIEGAGAKTALAAMAMGDPTVARVYQQVFAPNAGEKKMTEAQPGPSTGPAPAKVDELPEELQGHVPSFFTPTPDREQAHAAAWTQQKDTVSAPFMEGESQPSKDLLYAALLTAQNKKVNAGETTVIGMAGPGAGMGGSGTIRVDSSPARALLLAKKLNPNETIKVDGQSFTREEVLVERLKEIAQKRGYGKKAEAARGQELPRAATQSEIDALPEGTLFRAPDGTNRRKVTS